MTGVALAPAQDRSPDRSRHLMVVPDTPEAAVALARTDARVVAEYESFTLVEAAGADAGRLSGAGAEERDDMRTVETAAGAIDPARARRTLAGKDAPERDEVLALVQFVGPPKDAWLARLRETGVRVVTYQAENAYVVHASGEAVERLAALHGGEPFVRAVSLLTAADKLEERSSAGGAFAVSTVAGSAGGEARAEAAQAGAATATSHTVGAIRTDYRALSSAEAAALAAEPGVVAVEAVGEPALFDERSSQIVAGNLTPALAPIGPGYLAWLVQPDRIPTQDTFDFAIDVTDTGFGNGADPPLHSDFNELGQPTNPDRVSYNVDYTSDVDARDCDGHGTNVASVAVGYNNGTGSAVEDAAGFNHGLGVAPFARVGGSKIWECDGDLSGSWTPAELAEDIWAGGARVSNNSWGHRGISSWGDYSSFSRAYDAVVRDASPNAGNQQLVEVMSAGNDGEDVQGFPNEGYGTISPEGSAKNVITVGASEGVRPSGTDGCGTPNSAADSARDIVNFSSRGPTNDGRVKPDLVAPGTHVLGAAPQHASYVGNRACNPFFSGTTLYSLFSGTSQAAPAVSGAAALLRHWWQRTRGVEPSPALLKAMLVNSAADLGGGQNGKGDTIAPGPNNDQGWGRLDLGRAWDSTTRQHYDQQPGDMLDFSGDAVTRSFAVQDTTEPVKVTLVWTDAPGPTSGNPAVNNLDLEVTRPEGAYRGNVFAGAWSRTGGATDPRNNVESVYLPPGTDGRFAVRVRATVLAGNGVPGNPDGTDQDFALVVSNAVEQPAPVLAHDATTLDDSPGDGDGAIESDEEFLLNERVRNGGDVEASGLSAFLSSPSPNLTVTQASAGYPTLAPGAAAQNDTPFAAKVANAATCGVDLPATLEITSTAPAEVHTIPLMLPTGAPGTPETVPASGDQVGLVIPDDDAGGVSSSVFVPAGGRIRDIDVTIPGDSINPGLDHPWVGDLRIDLIGPDGTTVVLVNHPGGPDNGGKDFGGTVFDDEAGTNISQGTAPYTGSFRPQNDQLSRFDGKPRRGTWTLRVRDLFEGDVGTLMAWGVTTQRAVCDIDTLPPNTQVDSFPGSPVSQTTAHFTFSSPNDPTATFECRLDTNSANAWEPCTAPHTVTNLADGDHIFWMRAVDGSGNVDPSPSRHEWTVDTTPPESTIDSGPSGFTSATDAQLSFSTEANATLECSLDGAAFAACTSPVDLTGLGEGSHTFAVQARDLAGNLESVPSTRTWTVDTTAPAPSVSSPANGSTTQDRSPLLRGTGGNGPGDASSVLVRVFEGGDVTGQQIESYNAGLGGSGEWSVVAGEGTLLEPGQYTVEVRQDDQAGNGPGVATSTFTISDDVEPPAVSVTAPPSGATFSDPTPSLSGKAGTDEGDEGQVTVEVFAGAFAAGLPAQTMIVPRDSATGVWSVELGALGEGTWTVRVTQSDSASNTGSALITFVIDLPDPPPPVDEAPAFILAPAEERLADVLAGRLSVTAACAAACEITAGLTIRARQDSGGRTTARATRVKRLAGAGTATVPVRLGRRARAAVRGARSARGTLSVRLESAGETLTLKRPLSLVRSAGLRRVVARGLGMWAVCSESCPLTGSLTLAPREARRIGLGARGTARVQVASGRANGTARKPVKLTLRVKRSAKKALRGARKVRAMLETVAGPAAGPRRAAERNLTLRR